MARFRVGTSGWHYEHWGGGVFYPPGLAKTRWFSFYTRHFDTVELNNTFYRLPQEKTFRAWGQKAPAVGRPNTPGRARSLRGLCLLQ